RSLHDEIIAYARYIAPTRAEDAARERVRACVEDVVMRTRFHDGRVSAFGSSVTGLCLPNGDIDLVVQTRHVQTENNKRGALFLLRNALLRDGIVREAFVVTNARHLVMNMVSSDETGAFKVDISVNSTEGTRGMALIREYLRALPALRPLVMVLRGLLAQHGLGAATSAGLSSYVTICMAISFLQLNPAGLPREALENPFDSGSLGALLLGFLQYYADDFPYTTSYISVREQAVLPKVAKSWPPRKHEDALSIECLVDPENDIARAAQRIGAVRELFRKTRDTLRAAADDSTGASSSALASVLGVSQDVGVPFLSVCPPAHDRACR
ncbi:hypothetical protein K488DRAFT_46910, partial [Vararia minispora EC-137]